MLWVIALYIGTIGILSINNVVPVENVRKAQILIGAFAIYIPFLFESGLVVWDIKSRYADRCFRDGILNYLCWMLINIPITIILSLLFYFKNYDCCTPEYYNYWLVPMFISMAIAKAIVCFFSANVNKYLTTQIGSNYKAKEQLI